MDKRLYRLVLDQVEAVVRNKPPSVPSLVALLQIGTPNLTEEQLTRDKAKRDSAFKVLKSLIHPDKHAAAFRDDPQELARISTLFQDTVDFYYLCCDSIQYQAQAQAQANQASNNNNRLENNNGSNNNSNQLKLAADQGKHKQSQQATHDQLVPSSGRSMTTTTNNNSNVHNMESSKPVLPSQESLRAIYEATNGGPSASSRRDSFVRSVSPVRATSTNFNTGSTIMTSTSRPQQQHSYKEPDYGHHHHQQQPQQQQMQRKHQQQMQQQQVQPRPQSTSPHRGRQLQTKREEAPSFSILDAYAMSGGKLPVSMDAWQAWPFVDPPSSMVEHNNKANKKLSSSELAWIMACRCLNVRGSVLHGQRLGYHPFQVTRSSKQLNQYQTVHEVLQHFGFSGQSHLFKTRRDIQHEIMQNGPLLSVSFRPNPIFFQIKHNSFLFNMDTRHINQQHPVLIVGWTIGDSGEQWKVQSLYGNEIVLVGFGQWEIDNVLAAPPVASLESVPWQAPGPFLDLKMPMIDGNRDWRDSESLGISLTFPELEHFSGILNTAAAKATGNKKFGYNDGGDGPGGFRWAITNRSTFVIRDKYKLAYSRRYILQEVFHNQSNNKWKITVLRVLADHEQEPKPQQPPGDKLVLQGGRRPQERRQQQQQQRLTAGDDNIAEC